MATGKTVRILIVILLGLLGFAAFWQYAVTNQRPIPTILYPTALPAVFPNISPTMITKIVVENHQNKRKFVYLKVPGDWTATDESGKPAQADLNQIAQMISILPSLRYNRRMNVTNLRDFGLADGGVFIVQFDADRSYTLKIGDHNADSTAVYVQIDTDSAVLSVPYDPIAASVASVDVAVGTASATAESTGQSILQGTPHIEGTAESTKESTTAEFSSNNPFVKMLSP